MGPLLLTDDELALLRFTCDLFFTTESPLFYIEQTSREPQDFAAAYHSLVEKKVVDPKTFRLTDMALNRLAPLTECDARIVMLHEQPGAEAQLTDHYLLDEIAVEYHDEEQGHEVGVDRDHDELVEHLCALFAPRRSRGDFVEVDLSTGEYLVFALLAQEVRSAPDVDRMSVAEILRALADLGLDDDDEKTLPNAPVRPYAARGGAVRPEANMAAPAPAPFDVSTALARPAFKSSLPTDPVWDGLVAKLEAKGVVKRDKLGHASLKPAYAELAKAIRLSSRVSFVRYDFVDDEWLLRETTFLPVEGSLFFLGPTPEGTVAVRELDAARLELTLRAAVGPLPPSVDDASGKKAKDFFLRA